MILMYSFGLIGNCHVSALVSYTGAIEWLCLPEPDSEPVFARILDPEGGAFSISLENQRPMRRQYYSDNTNVLITELETNSDAIVRITDFCPRFERNGTIHCPNVLYRIIEPVRGEAKIQIQCDPVLGWSKRPAAAKKNERSIVFEGYEYPLRLLSHANLTNHITLKSKLVVALTWGDEFGDEVLEQAEEMFSLTTRYWQNWVKHCSIPTLFQSEVIRSALILKLHCHQKSGAILAALTTSLPEEAGGARNWDYRYCWLRDAYFVLSAIHNLGHFEEVEGFIKFLLGVAHTHPGSNDRLAPVYTTAGGLPLPEVKHENWTGYLGGKPVRSYNQAAEHIQNDVYGELILTLSPIFLDERFLHLRHKDHEDLLTHLAKLNAKKIGEKDAGLWEFRNGWREHSFSNMMIWAGLDRLESIKSRGYLRDLELDLASEKQRAELRIRAGVVENSLRNGPEDTSFDAALALLPVLRFPDRELCERTVELLMAALSVDNNPYFFYRYLRTDDFGKPQSAFLVCSFWVVQALAALGRKEAARELLKHVTSAANHLGLYSEHFRPVDSQQFGNFPQAYSHVGLINSAFAVSPPWSEIL